MSLRALLICIGLLLAPVRAQEQSAERVDLRITALVSGRIVVVDRGSRDHLLKGDTIRFYPREGGGPFIGKVLEVDPRSSRVELRGMALLPVGTPGRNAPPGQRFGAPSGPAPGSTAGDSGPGPAKRDSGSAGLQAQGPGESAQLEDAADLELPWARPADDWTPDDALLARVDVLRPDQRPRRTSGRLYAVTDTTLTSRDDRSHGFYRTGGRVLVENPFGQGGELNLDGEANYRFTQHPDDSDESEGKLRLDRFSYAIGGTRHSDQRVEVGRFLLDGMPEFGVVDGAEWSRRLDSGDSFGASLGYMPEPDADYETGQDLQVSAWYRWVADPLETLSATAGYQKTFHDFDTDRDLLVAKLEYYPDAPEAWDFQSSAWIDVYTGDDNQKDDVLGLTQLNARTGRRFDNDATLDFTYRHLEFPEIDRWEFTEPTAEDIADDHDDRLTARGSVPVGERESLHAQLGGWTDEDDTGGDAELGMVGTDYWLEASRLDISGFASAGKFVTVLGARASYGQQLRNGRWDVLYEFAHHDQDGFDEDNDDIPQHRVRGSRDFFWGSGWNLSTYAQGIIWDDEGGLTLGFYLQKSF